MGAADVVPGVSGGTMAFILGIYEELIGSIRAVGTTNFWRPLSRGRINEAAAAINLKFLIAVLAGILIAIVSLARLLEHLLETQPVYLWSFFFGLVLASVFVVARRIEHWKVSTWVLVLSAAVAAWILVGLVPLQTPDAWWFFFLSGALAICAMILPGISGAFILLLLGKYGEVLAAVNARDLVTIGWVALGAILGLVLFSRVLTWLFRHYHDLTVAALTGLMLGSLRKIWPWKVDIAWIVDAHGARVPTVQANVLPEPGSQFAIAIAIALAGMLAVIILEKRAEIDPHGEKT
ncbi:MAG: DUF368 domain-containing protein [Acidobacteria bacterium]|nr:DUF368 domain-containing protein [Acidobacteriota bacterium]